MPASCDLLVVGGGPAGSTLATLVKKRNPSARVVLVEMERFPRHHIGESLLPTVPPILKEMGVLEKVASAGFPKKLGATYVWGGDRKPWTADFEDLTVEQRAGMQWDREEPIAYSWQVHRAKYDHILLEHARESGVEVLQGRAEGIIESGDRIVGAKIVLQDGTSREISSRLLADCSGQRGFLSQFRRIRRFDERLRNVALYAYFRGAAWHTRFVGHPDKTRIFICAVERGWFWYIPIDKDLVSVGLVTTRAHLQDGGIKDLRAFFSQEVSRCPEIANLLKDARQEQNVDGSGKDFFTVKDWSYLCDEAAGPGWMAAGDAAVFVDPVFSSGVTIAHLSAQRAAYTITRAWAKASPALESALWRDYSAYARDCASAFLIMALYWYGNDRTQQSLWKKAWDMYQARLPQSISDFGAYLGVVSGVLATADRLLGFDPEKPRSEDFFNGICDPASMARLQELLKKVQDDAFIPSMRSSFSTELAFLPDPKSGTLIDAVRVRFTKHRETDSVSDVLNPRMIAGPMTLALLKGVDGRRSLGEIKDALAARYGLSRRNVDEESALLFRQLLIWDVLEFKQHAAR